MVDIDRSNFESGSGSGDLSTGDPAKPQCAESRAAKTLREAIESGRPLTYIRSAEEQRVGRLLREVGVGLLGATPVPVWEWSLTEGMHRVGEVTEVGTEAPREALDFIIGHKDAAIFHLKDFHEPLRESPEIRRRLRDVYESCLGQRKFVVITSPVRSIPEEVERSVMFLELRPPDLIELVDFLREEALRISPPSESGDTSEAYGSVRLRPAQGLVPRATMRQRASGHDQGEDLFAGQT